MRFLDVCLGSSSPKYEHRPQLQKLKLNQQLAPLLLETHRINFSVFFVSEDAIPICLMHNNSVFVCATADLRSIKRTQPISNGVALAPVVPLQIPTNYEEGIKQCSTKTCRICFYICSNFHKRLFKRPMIFLNHSSALFASHRLRNLVFDIIYDNLVTG